MTRTPSSRRGTVLAATFAILILAFLRWGPRPWEGAREAQRAAAPGTSLEPAEPTRVEAAEGLGSPGSPEGAERALVSAAGESPAAPTPVGVRDPPRVVMALVDLNGCSLDGRPVQGTLLGARLVQGDERARPGSAGVEIQVAEDGRSTASLPPDPAADATRWLELDFRPRALLDGTPSQPWRARVPLPDALSSGRVRDLGRIVLLPDEIIILVRGFVVDEGEAPVAGARVSAVTPSSMFSRPRFDSATLTDSDGRFELRGPADVGMVSCFVGKDGFLDAPLPSPATAGGEVLARLRRSARIRGRVRLDEGVSPARLQIQFSGAPGEPSSGLARWDADVFESPELAAGLYDVHVLVDTMAPTLLVATGIEAGAVGERLDPRLDPLDLRGTVEELRLFLRSAQGEPLGHCAVGLELEGWGSFTTIADDQGRVTCFAPVASTPWRIAPHGYREQSFVPVRGELALDFEPL
jgi:hypothetical protein